MSDQPEPDGIVGSIRVVRREVDRLTQITLAIGSSLGNRLGPSFDSGGDSAFRAGEAGNGDHRAEPDAGWPDLALGITLAVQDAFFDGVERIGASIDSARPAAERVARLPFVAPVWGPVRDRVRANLEALTDRGIDARADGRDYANRMLDALLADATASPRMITVANDVIDQLAEPLIDGALPVALDKLASDPAVVMALLEKLLEPILDSALPVAFEKLGDDPEAIVALVRAILDPVLAEALPSVLDQLNRDPDVVRTLVLGQSTSMATELANTVRSRAVTGDDRLERIARRITARKPKFPASRPLAPADQRRSESNEIDAGSDGTDEPRIGP